MKRIYMSLLMTLVSFAAVADPVTVELEAFAVWKQMNGGTFGGLTSVTSTLPAALPTEAGISDNALRVVQNPGTAGTWTSLDLGDPVDASVWVGFWLMLTDPDLQVQCDFHWFTIGPTDDDWDVALKLTSDLCNATEHKLCVTDANDNDIECIDDPFEQYVWYWIDIVYFQSNVGWVTVWITNPGDTRSVDPTMGTHSAKDLETATSGGREVRLNGQKNSIPFVGSTTFYIKNLIIQEGVHIAGLDIGPPGVYSLEIAPYKSGVTPDCDENGNTASLDDLSAGDWDDISDNNFTTIAIYAAQTGGAIAADDNTATGVLGPFTENDWHNLVYGCRFGWRAGGVNPSGDNQLIWGKRLNPTNFVVNKEEPAACGRTCNHTELVLPGTTYFPDYNQYAVMGFSSTHATSDVKLLEARCWYFSQYVPHSMGIWDRMPSGTILRGQNRGGG